MISSRSHVAAFVTAYPLIYHVSEAGAWASIRRLGLLSTTALLDRFEIAGEERHQIESRRRREAVEIDHPRHGRAWIRDNKPLRESVLAARLDGMSPEQWYEALNSRVFFWVHRARAATLVGARAHRGRDHDVLVVDTRALIEVHGEQVALAAINTGAALFPNAPRRGAATFRPLTARDATERAVELTVAYAVDDIETLTLRVERWQSGRPPAVLWTPGV